MLNPVDMTEADFDTLAYQSAAQDAANGVCSLCDEALNPLLPKWASSYKNPRYTQEMAAKAVGPVMADLPYHQICFDEARCG